jgi:hypothetical protein
MKYVLISLLFIISVMLWVSFYRVLTIVLVVLITVASIGAIRESINLKKADKYRDSQ